MTSDDLLQQGIVALKAGNKGTARDLLLRVVEQDATNEMAWLWLSGAVETDAERLACLQKVLAINPHNRTAQRGINTLQKKAPALKPAPVEASARLVVAPETSAPSSPHGDHQAAASREHGELLGQAVDAVMSGEFDRGTQLLIEILEQNDTDETAWFWMIRCASDRSSERHGVFPSPAPVQSALHTPDDQQRKHRNHLLVATAAAAAVAAIVLAALWWVLLGSRSSAESSGTAALIFTQIPTAQPATATREPSPTPQPTWTRAATRTPMPTNTRVATSTPRATGTPRPTFTAVALPTPVIKTLGPIREALLDEAYTIEVALDQVRFESGSAWSRANSSMTYAISYVTIKNLGPGDMTSVSDFRFMLRDGNGALRSPSYVSSASDCRLASVQLPPGGSVSGCVGFETPAAGSLELIYKAFTFGDLEPGNHLVFSIRP